MTRKTFVCSLSVLALVAVACSSDDASAPRERRASRVLTVGLAAEPSSLDPHARGDGASFDVYKYALESLVWWSSDLKLTGLLATGWNFSADATKLEVDLRTGVRFHDGGEFNAAAVKANFDRLLNPQLNLLGSSAFRGLLDSVDVVSDSRVRFNLMAPKPSFVFDLANSYSRIMSPMSLQRPADQLAASPIGTGPYEFVEWVPHQAVRFRAFSGYWGEAAGSAQLVLRPIPDQAARIAALEAGDIDVAESPSTQDVERVGRRQGFKVLSHDGVEAFVYHMNLRKRPLADIRVRQALNHAINKEAIAERIYGGLARPLDSPIAAAVTGYSPVGSYAYDPRQAQRLLAEAGFRDGLKLVLWSPAGRYLNDRQLNEAVAGYLRDVGVEVEIVSMENTVYLERLRAPSPDAPPEYDLALLTATPGTGEADALWRLMIESGSRPPNFVNVAFYASPEVDALVARARQTLDPSGRNALHAQIQQIVWRDAPWIFLISPKQVALAKAGVSGERFSLFQLDLHHASRGES